MLTVERAEIDRIVKMRVKTLRIAVKHGEFGELRRCRLILGHHQTLIARVPYNEIRAEMDTQASTRAQGVISLIDRCLLPQKTVDITITSVKRDKDEWIVGFERGDQREKPRLLAANPGAQRKDYVSSPSLALRGATEEVEPAIQARYAAEAADGLRIARNSEWADSMRRLHVLIDEIRRFAPEPRINENLRGLERQARSLERKLQAA